MLFDILMLIVIAMTPFFCVYSFKLGFSYGKGEPPKPFLPKRDKEVQASEEELELAKRLDEINNFEFGENK